MTRLLAFLLFAVMMPAQSLSDLAVSELEAGDVAAAERDAHQLLQLAAAHPADWDHDDLVHAANTILGRAALKRGNLKEAEARLLDSGRVTGSAALRSFGPNMSLAQELLDAGEREVVLQYFEMCRGFWKYDRGRIDQFLTLARTEPAEKAPAFRLKDLSGNEWTLDRLSGKMVAIDFWTTWCARCRDELPILEKLANELKGRGVVIFAVNVGEDEATVRRFLQENHLSVPVLLGGEDTIVLNYKVEAYPTLAVIDRNGDLSSKFAGGAGEADLRRTLGVE